MTTLFLTDDDSWTLRGIEQTLSQAPGFEVIGTARQGDQAVRQVPHLNPDIVLMDVSMPPGISGIEATKLIKAECPEQVIVTLTTTAEAPGTSRALQAGSRAVIHKTLPPEKLIAALTAIAADEPGTYLTALHDPRITTAEHLGAPRMPELTRREADILTHICCGLGYGEIALAEHLSTATVRTHAERLRTKLGANSMSQLVVHAIRHKLYIPR